MLTPIAPENIASVWPWVRPGIQKIIDKTHETFLPEDVYIHLKNKTAHLYVVDDAGFVVFELLLDKDNSRTLHIWLIWGKYKEIYLSVFDEIDKLAKHVGAKRIRWISPRKGWARVAKLSRYVYEREVF